MDGGSENGDRPSWVCWFEMALKRGAGGDEGAACDRALEWASGGWPCGMGRFEERRSVGSRKAEAWLPESRGGFQRKMGYDFEIRGVLAVLRG